MTSRNQSLDVLRGIAILLVIGFHLHLPGPFRFGWVGVDLFFVLSGFLISGLLFSDYRKFGQVEMKRFWIRRAFKILPPLYFFLAATAAVMLIASRGHSRLPGFVRAATFSLNYSPWGGLEVIGHTWSLAVEEQFYLLLPPLLFFLSAKGKLNWIPAIALSVGILCFVLRMFTPRFEPFHLRADALFAGVLLRYIFEFRGDWFIRCSGNLALVVGSLFWLPPFLLNQSSGIQRTIMYSLISISAASLIAWSVRHDELGAWKRLRVLSGIGLYSYSIYLWQEPVTMLFREGHLRALFVLTGFAMSIGMGISMAKLIEVPSLRLREHLFPASMNRKSNVSITPVRVYL